MPPEGYTTVTISEETAAKIAEVAVERELESMADAIEYSVDRARGTEPLSDAELARLLYRRLADDPDLP
jgi:hypothetical protein